MNKELKIFDKRTGVRFPVLLAGLVAAAAALAGEFPYETKMTVRHEKDSAEVSSFTTPVEIPAVNEGMPATDSVATLFADVVDFCASDDETWAAGTEAVDGAQAAFTMRLADGVRKWMCYANGKWVELAGVAAEEGAWQVRVEIDYSLGEGNERVRYSVGKPAAELTPLSAGGETWLALGNAGSAAGEQKINFVRLYGAGETGLVEAKSGCRQASGTISVGEGFGREFRNLKLDVSVVDPWGVDFVEVELKDAAGQHVDTKIVALVDGAAKVDFSGVTPCDTYTYGLSLKGSRRGADLSYADEPKEVLIGVEADWFAFKDGEFEKAAPDANVTLADNRLSAAPVTPRGLVVPTAAAPRGTKVVVLDSTLVVAGAVRVAALQGLDAANTQGALTVVRFSDGERAWACRTPEGWVRLSGATAANGTYDVRMELDYRDGTRGVSYSVKVGGSWVRLADANDETRTCFGLPEGAAVMTKASLLGGSVSYLNAVTRSAPVLAGLMLIFN